MSDVMFLVCGYISFIAFICVIMAVGVIFEKKIKSDKIISRKLVHIVASLLWIICWYFFGCSIHWVILNGVGALALGIITFGSKMKVFYGGDVKTSYGIFYFSLSTFIVALICYFIGEEAYLYTGIAYYCLALGDGFAPIVAKLLKKCNPEIMPGKTVFGSLTVFIVSFFATLAFSAVFGMGLNLLFVFSVAALTCITEFYGIRGIDNLLIEFGVFGYLLLYHFGYVTAVLEIVVLVSPFIACLAVGLRSLTVSGGICGMILFYLVAFFGRGFVPVLSISVLFAITAAVSLITQKAAGGRVDGNPVKSTRSGKQLAAVGMAAAICIIVYYFTGWDILLLFYYLAITEQFADTMASDIGRLTRGKNIDIVRFKPVEKGISGGVSLLGTACALFSCLLLLAIPLLCGDITPAAFFAVAAIAFAGTLIDSVLGSLFQALYECGVCGKITENRVHCDCRARLVKGFKWMDNTAVNLFTSFATCALGTLLLLI